ncbi:MAG: SulP family inorganic anion transporter, partial [Myxococcales bacterium]|nr:SulP family inorganic anion transporter [Myxococcales bacterium]
MFELSAARRQSLRADLLSGLTVALALVPEAVAFAFVAGVPPKVGLTAAFFVCLLTAVLGGRPGMISGATGALAVVAVGLVQQHGLSYLLAAVVLMGVLQIGAGLLNLGRFVRLVPHPVMLGFVNGLAIVIALAQLGQFGQGGPGWAAGTLLEGTAVDVAWLPGPALGLMAALVGVTMAVIYLWPRVTKAVPAPLVAIVGVSLAVGALGFDTRRVGDVAAIGGGLPTLALPPVPFTWETLRIIFPTALVMAAVGLIESLLTLTLVDELTQTKGSTRRECLGQGAANVVTGFFGGMGGCAMIGQSMINVTSGGRGRLSGITAALALLAFTLWLAPLIELIPVAALVGVMFVVVIGTFEWSSFRILRRIPKGDAAVLVLVSAITVVTDLAVAVAVGVVASALVFAWEHA